MAEKTKDDTRLDRSDAADAARFRWLLNGNGYFMEEEGLCSCTKNKPADGDEARIAIDECMADERKEAL